MYIEGDVPSVVTGNGGNNGGFGFGNNDAWVLIILFALIFGWNGNNGWGGNGSAGAMDNYVLASDFATLQRQIDSGVSSLERKGDAINSGLCDGFYAMNTGMLNGFAGVNSAITTSGYETRNAISNLGSQLATCCCDLKGGIKDTQYAIAMQTNSIQQALCTGFRDVIDSQNANYRALHDEIVANRIEDKNAQIAAQQNEINALRLKASQTEQNQYLIGQLKPCPSAAYIVPNPNCCYNYSVTPNCCGGTCGAVV